MLDFGPTWLAYNAMDPRQCQEYDSGSEWHSVFGVLLYPATAGQNICWMQSGQVRERGVETEM